MPPGRFVTDAGDVPAAAMGAVWWSLDTREHPVFGVERLGSSGVTTMASTTSSLGGGALLIPPTGAVTPGATYRFTATSDRSPATRVELRAAPLSSDGLKVSSRLVAGPLARARVSVEDGGGACSTTVDAVTRVVSIELPPVARPFAGAMLYTTTVDGRPWNPRSYNCSAVPFGRSWTDRGTDRVFADCPVPKDPRGLAPGKHRVELRAALPGGGLTFASSADVDLDCP